MSCPVEHNPKSSRDECPVKSKDLNPLNNIPVNLPINSNLSTQRECSGIPKKANQSDNKWEYPSPNQFYAALVRKGKEAPENEIDNMVAIHNFINEGSWKEIQAWEEKYHCECKDLGLLKFQGSLSRS